MQDTARVRPHTVERLALADRVYEVLKGRILDREVAPGARLVIDALARELRVSSTPLREALARLAAEELVTSAPFMGFAVAPLPERGFFRDLFAFRLVLEPWAAAEVARRRPPAAIDALGRAVEAMAAGSLSRDYQGNREFTTADEAFHRALHAGTGNAVACRAFEDLRVHTRMARLYIDREQDAAVTRAEHAAILDAIAAGDADGAAAAARHHLEVSRARLLDDPG